MREELKESVEIGLCSFSLGRLRLLYALLVVRLFAIHVDHRLVGLDRCFAAAQHDNTSSMTKSVCLHGCQLPVCG